MRRTALICSLLLCLSGSTFAATAEVVAWMGATPIFAEIDEPTYNIDPKGLAAALDTARKHEIKPRALVHRDGDLPAEHDPPDARQTCQKGGQWRWYHR